MFAQREQVQLDRMRVTHRESRAAHRCLLRALEHTGAGELTNPERIGGLLTNPERIGGLLADGVLAALLGEVQVLALVTRLGGG